MSDLMQIGELADRAGLSLRTIRHWEEEGLIVPSARSVGGFRLYSGTDLDRLLLISRMKPLGFSLEEMREVLLVVDALNTRDDTNDTNDTDDTDDTDASKTTDATDSAHRTDRPARTRLAGFLAQAQERREKLRVQLDMADEFVERLRGL